MRTRSSAWWRRRAHALAALCLAIGTIATWYDVFAYRTLLGLDAAIAWSDRAALDVQISALEQSYVASRRSRDVLVERFRVARGDLFDVLGASDAYFEATARYIEALSQRDAARYVLLSRTGRLLPALGITSAMGRTR